jgi:hypothetical protein
MVTQFRYSVVGRSRGQVTSCAICIVHDETRSAGFLVEPQNQGGRFASGLASKLMGRFFPVWPQNRWRQFVLKIGGFGFPGLALKIGGYNLVIWASKPPRWFLGLGLKTMQATVCRLCHKTNKKMKTT